MSKIKIEDITSELKKKGWKLLSDNYKNLRDELIFECPEGHKVYSSWGKIRNKFECPVCKQNQYKNQLNTIQPKKKNCKRILALDQATHLTGWSIFDNGQLIKYGIFKTDKKDEIERYSIIKNWLINMINNWKPDLVGLEDIQLQDFSQQGGIYSKGNVVGLQTFKKLAQLQGVLLETIFNNNLQYNVCSSSTWRHHCNIKGKSRIDRKRGAQLLVKKNFDVTVTEDEADAICIGKYLSDIYSSIEKIEEWE